MSGSSLEIDFERGVRADAHRPPFTLECALEWSERTLVLFGPSGSGKSTLIECILGLHPRARARICIGGRWLDDHARGIRLAPRERGLGWVPQAPLLFPHLDVAGNLALGARRAGGRAGSLIRQAAGVLGIEALLDRRPEQLSGGEQSRVALARAIASGPEALLLDEPLSALDIRLRARVLPYLLRIRDELELPMLYITHDPDEAMLLGERVAVIDGGRILASGDPREVLWSQAVLPLAQSLGVENVFEARASGAHAVRTAGGLELSIPWRVEAGTVLSLGIPAQDVLVAIGATGRVSAQNTLPCRVRRCEVRGEDCFVHLETRRGAEPLVAWLTPAAADALNLEAGSEVQAIVKAQSIRRLR